MPRLPDLRLLGTSGGAGAVTGTGALSSGAATLAGAGTRTLTGTGALAAGVAALAGVGLVTHVGTGALQAGVATVSGAGVVTHVGSGALASGAATLTGDGTVATAGGITGTGALASGAATLAGAGTVTHVGTGALAAATASLAGAGTLTHVGTGALASGAATLAGTGTYSGASACLALDTVIRGSTTVQDLFEAMLDMVAAYTAARAAKLDYLDAAVSSRLASAAYTAPDNTGIAAIKANTDNLTPTRAGLLDNLAYLDARNLGPLLLKNPMAAAAVLDSREIPKP